MKGDDLGGQRSCSPRVGYSVRRIPLRRGLDYTPIVHILSALSSLSNAREYAPHIHNPRIIRIKPGKQVQKMQGEGDVVCCEHCAECTADYWDWCGEGEGEGGEEVGRTEESDVGENVDGVEDEKPGGRHGARRGRG